ncbi:hypothetical protein BJ742DRAFT_398288 [Cladochytrium replicatum]|nr:hypothetical protein BJ742DRAFT_398288 [Cladochytrium replicatum]
MNPLSASVFTSLAAPTSDRRNAISATQNLSPYVFPNPRDCLSYTMPFSEARQSHVALSATSVGQVTHYGRPLSDGTTNTGDSSKISQEQQDTRTMAYVSPPDSLLTRPSLMFGVASVNDPVIGAAVSFPPVLSPAVVFDLLRLAGPSQSSLDNSRLLWGLPIQPVVEIEHEESLGGGPLFAPIETFLDRSVFSHNASQEVLKGTLFPQRLDENLGGNQTPLMEWDSNSFETFNEMIPGLLIDLKEFHLSGPRETATSETLENGEELAAFQESRDCASATWDGEVFEPAGGEGQEGPHVIDGGGKHWLPDTEHAGNVDMGLRTQSTSPAVCLFPSATPTAHPEAIPSHTSRFSVTHERDLSSAISAGILELSGNAAFVTTEKLGQLLLHAKSRRSKRKPGHPCTVPGCLKTFPRKYNLTQHLQTHQRNRVRNHLCPVCPATYSKAKDLQRHVAIGNHKKNACTPKEFGCTNAWCTKVYAKRKKLQAHQEKCTPDTKEKEKVPMKLVQDALGRMEIKLRPGEGVWFVKDQILEFLKHREELKEHRCSVVGCSGRFDRKFNLKAHLQNVHKIVVKEEKQNTFAGEQEGEDGDDDEEEEYLCVFNENG